MKPFTFALLLAGRAAAAQSGAAFGLAEGTPHKMIDTASLPPMPLRANTTGRGKYFVDCSQLSTVSAATDKYEIRFRNAFEKTCKQPSIRPKGHPDCFPYSDYHFASGQEMNDAVYENAAPGSADRVLYEKALAVIVGPGFIVTGAGTPGQFEVAAACFKTGACKTNTSSGFWANTLPDVNLNETVRSDNPSHCEFLEPAIAAAHMQHPQRATIVFALTTVELCCLVKASGGMDWPVIDASDRSSEGGSIFGNLT